MKWHQYRIYNFRTVIIYWKNSIIPEKTTLVDILFGLSDDQEQITINPA